MTGYSGPSISNHGEVARRAATLAGSRSSAWSNLRFEKATIKDMSKDGNYGTVMTNDGELYRNIRVQSPSEFISFFYGLPSEVKDIPCLLIYRSSPEDGFVIIGDLGVLKSTKKPDRMRKPFYM